MRRLAIQVEHLNWPFSDVELVKKKPRLLRKRAFRLAS